MIVYRKANIEDKSALFDFYKKAYPKVIDYRVDPLWTWQNIENPLVGKETSTYVYVAIDTSKDIIVGQYVLVPQEFIFGDEKKVVYWGMYFYVLEEYRGEGIGKKLQQLTVENNQLYVAISVAWSTRKLILKLGGIELPEVYTLSYLLKPNSKLVQNQLVKYFRISKWSKPLSRIIAVKNPISFVLIKAAKGFFKRRIIRFNSNYRKGNSSDIFETSIDDSRFLDIRSLVKNDFDIYPTDNSESLKWRFNHHPVKEYKIFISDNDNWKGYLILRNGLSPEEKMGIISEVYATTHKGYNELLKFSINYFSDLDCENINVLFPVGDEVKLFESKGFMKINKRIPVVLASSSENPDRYRVSNKWFFSFESQDMDFFPNVRL